MKILWIILVGLWLLHEAECGRTIRKHLVSRRYGRGRAARNYRVTRQPLCEHGGCYPAVGNLLTGRARQLHASSTCGLHEPQKYCIMGDLNNNKCYICNSRRHNVDTSHRIHNVVPSFSSGPVRTWWQSENGVQEVSIRLDLEAEFHITHMIITFKTFRPAAAVIERSVNLGRTWQPYRYFAYDCADAFPGIPVRQQLWVGDVVCESRYSAIEPSSNGELIFKVLDPRLPIVDPYSQRIQDLLRVTNLRVNFTRLHTLGDNLLHPRTKVQQKYYYAVYEMVVHGNCFCYGHASQCIPIKPTEVMVPGKVHGRCLCTHNTAGINCERCKNFHMDTPWAPARDRHAHACKRCNCNGHSGKCSFDMAVFIGSGNVSGGVCDDCQHNTAGHHCQLCRPFYYRHPRRNVRSHDACVPCNCDKRGTKNGGHCDGLKDPTLRQIGGGCRCKANVEGVRCDRCKPGHFGLDTNNPLGCHPCGCDPRGTVSGTAACDPLTGSCTCKRMVTGHRCHQCQKGHWGLSFAEPNGCHPCTCDFGGAYDETCNPVDGQCRCRPHMQGKSCTHPAPGYFCMETFLNIYEAEAAHLVHSSANTVTVVRRRRRLGQEVTWTGSGFTKMHDGTGLEFSISDISHSMHYNVVIRYELKTLERWRAELMILGWSTDVLSSECESFNPLAYKQEVKLHKNSRNVAFPEAVCLKKGVIYTVRIHLWFEGLINPRPSTTLLIDSVVLRPSMSNVLPHGEASLRPGMLGCLLSPLQRLQRMPHHNCTQILCSISAIIHDGAIPCACNRFGSKNDICEAIGGQCPCHPMIIGRKCDTCTPQTYGHRPGSCTPCRCDPRGSVKEVCDAQTGQCECHVGKAGLRCDTCEPGRWDYPRCLLCNCRGRADHCDADTGFCLNCRRNSTGRHCENCLDGYYEDPSVGTGCIQCPCPGHPRNRVNAYSCHRHRVTQHMVCQCLPAYRGKKCELCAVGHYGHPLSPHSNCKPCDCSGNADMMAKDACHPQTGECLKCLHNSAGPHCAVCRDGYYGNASLQLCKDCQCNTLGTTPEACSLSTGLCRCQHITGKCSCLPGVHGHTCSRCNRGYWGLHSGGGCKPCQCNPTRSLGTRCHPDTGQCHCLHGYGGLTCASCQEDHWGSAYTYCLPCNCSQWGVATSGRICKASTGHCLCRNGSTGQRCEKCMRGYHREYERPCKECHVCFKLWNKAISELLTEAAELFSRPLDLCMGNSSWNGELDEVERIIDEVRGIMEILPALNSPVHEFQKRISQTGRKVEVLFQTLSTSHSEVEDIDMWLKHTLVEVASIGKETIKLDQMLQEITEQKDNLPDATSTSAPDIVISYIKDIKEAHAKSTKAEEQAMQATTGPRSPIRRSESIRKQTTNVLENALKIQQNNTNILKNMSTIVNNLGVENLSRKVCGSNMNESCDEARSCGGTLCKESHGWWCGGDKCKGLVQLSKNTLNDANAASVTVAELFKNLSRQLSQVEKVKKYASDAKSIANKAILRAFDAAEIVQNASDGIDDILQRYSDFSIGVDPLEVEDLALKTLNITLPASDAEINKLIVQIMSALEALNKMDLKLTLEEVQDMSKKAQDARKQALKTNSEVQKAKRTLTDVDIIQKDTEQKMDVANDRVKKSSEELEQAKLQMRAVKLNVSETGDRLARLGAAVKQLQLKTNTIIATMEEIKEDVNHSSQDAQRVYQNLQTVSLNIDNLHEKYVDKANVSALINGRIGDIVEKLANITDMQNMLQKIEDQKKKISEQREVMQDRQKQIENMNKEVKEYKKKIDDVIIKYNHCALLR